MPTRDNGQRNLKPSTITRTLPSAEKAARTHRRTKPLHTFQTPTTKPKRP